jgi:hypothetical protein
MEALENAVPTAKLIPRNKAGSRRNGGAAGPVPGGAHVARAYTRPCEAPRPDTPPMPLHAVPHSVGGIPLPMPCHGGGPMGMMAVPPGMTLVSADVFHHLAATGQLRTHGMPPHGHPPPHHPAHHPPPHHPQPHPTAHAQSMMMAAYHAAQQQEALRTGRTPMPMHFEPVRLPMPPHAGMPPHMPPGMMPPGMMLPVHAPKPVQPPIVPAPVQPAAPAAAPGAAAPACAGSSCAAWSLLHLGNEQ